MDRPRRTVAGAKAVSTLVSTRRTRSQQDAAVESGLAQVATDSVLTEGPGNLLVFTAGSFERMPLELLQRICELAAGADVTTSVARRTLSSLRLVSRGMCLVASRVAHTHVFVTQADHARHLLDAILVDAKKRPSEAPSQTTFYARDIHALTIRDTRTSGRSIVSVLMRLPTAIRRLPKLRALTWASTERPTADILRALAKAPALRELEICDTNPVNPGPASGKTSYETYARISLFPEEGFAYNLRALTHLTLRLKVNPDGQYGGNVKWHDFCARALAKLQKLESLVVEMGGRYVADTSPLCCRTWPRLRRLGLKGIHFRFPADFLARHPALEELDLHDPETNIVQSCWPAVARDLEREKTLLPNLRRLAIDALAASGFVQQLLFTGFRPLTEVCLHRSLLFDRVYGEMRERDSPHVAIRGEAVEVLRTVCSSLEHAFELTKSFPNLRELHLASDTHWKSTLVLKSVLETAALPSLQCLGITLDPNEDNLRSTADVDAICRQRAAELVVQFPALRELHIQLRECGSQRYTGWYVVSWTPRKAEDGSQLLEAFEIDDLTHVVHASTSLPWPLPSSLH